MHIMSSKGLKVVIQNVELVAVAVMSVDLLQLGLVKGLVPGLVQVVGHLVHVVLGQGGAVQRVLGYGDHHSCSGVRSWTSEQLPTSSATLLSFGDNFNFQVLFSFTSQTHKMIFCQSDSMPSSLFLMYSATWHRMILRLRGSNTFSSTLRQDGSGSSDPWTSGTHCLWSLSRYQVTWRHHKTWFL